MERLSMYQLNSEDFEASHYKMLITSSDAHAWNVFFGHHEPIPDERRLKTNIFFANEYKKIPKIPKPRTDKEKKEEFMSARCLKKVRRGIKVLVARGINNNSKICIILNERGFLTKHRGKGRGSKSDIYSTSTIKGYIRYVREDCGITRKNKAEQILEMLQRKTPRRIIKETLDTSDPYIREVAQDYTKRTGKKISMVF